jgi:Right handed beta helix region
MSHAKARLIAALGAAAVIAALTVSTLPMASAATVVTFYASPTGSGAVCSQSLPCSLTGAQSAVRSQLARTSGADVTVLLLDGTYRLASTWAFGAADSGSAGHPVVWQGAPGAHPVISGASQVTGWTEVGTSGVWSAPVPTGSASRQLYVNGQEVPVASASPSALGFARSWTGSSTGYSIAGDSVAKTWFGALTAAQVASVEFDYPGGNGAWTESRCRVASYSAAAGTLAMDEPCWADATQRSSFSQGSGGLPSMSTSTMPTLIADARALVHPGQWFLDSAAKTLYYEPVTGQQMTSLDVELPHLESLLQGAGTLAAPLHDVTFSGLQFSYATWNAPSATAGFADVQSNLRITGATNQGMCTFSTPAGTCPWGALTQPLANVSFSASKNITISGDRFAGLGGAGLSVLYGSSNTLVQGNEFTGIASTAILLGCTYDPLPTDSTEAAGIKQNCTPNSSAVSGDTIGTNEILTGTTVSGNIIHDIGTDYTSACGITLLFSRGTTITHNDLYDLPYTGITAGVIQGHVDQASTPQNSVNINEDNTISDNVFHDYLRVRSDGGAIYAEGHQTQYVKDANGTIDPTQTLAHGLQVTGNVAYNGSRANFTYYDDAGSEWINWQGNVAFGAGSASQGGCSPTGNFWITGNYFSNSTQSYPCAAPVNSNASGNTVISATPSPGAIPNSLLTAAGVAPALVVPPGPQIYYTSPTTSTTTQVLVAGEGFSSGMPVYVNGTQVSGVQHLSGGFLIVPVPAGTPASEISVVAPGAGGRLNDTDAPISYNGFSYAANRGLGDFDNDVHYATANGSTATLTFTGTGIQVYGELFTDQGNIGVSIDGRAQQTVSTVSTDGQRHSNVAVYTASGLASGSHTIVVAKLSGTYTTLDGFGTAGTTG